MKSSLDITILIIAAIMATANPVFASIPAIPSGVAAEASGTDIKVTWTSNTDHTEGYRINYGTVSTSLLSSVTVIGKNSNSASLENLEATTLYYIAVSAYSGNESSNNSEIKSVTTGTGTSKPDTPENFKIQNLEGITENSVPLAWSSGKSDDLKLYRIYYGKESGQYSLSTVTGNAEVNALTINNLEPGSRYFFSITSVNSSDLESGYSNEIAADTKPDTLAPPAPEIISAIMTGPDSIAIKIRHTLPGLADIKGFKIYWGTDSGIYGNIAADSDSDQTVTITGLSQNVPYYFAAKAFDYSENTSDYSAEKKAVIEKSKTFISDDTDFKGGCFIANIESCKDTIAVIGILAAILFIAADFFKKSRWLIMIAVTAGIFAPVSPAAAEQWKNNAFALKSGYFQASDSLYDDVYGNGAGPVTILYERRISGNFLGEIEAGYMWRSGYAVTKSGQTTGIKTELAVIPVSLGIQYEYEIIPFINIYGGMGGDFWHVSEKPSQSCYSETDEWIAGWHLKTGIKLFTESETWTGAGVILETVYSQVDRFGQNRTDIGGLSFNAGFFYRF